MRRSCFESSRALSALSTLGVGLALAGAASSAILRVLGETGGSHPSWRIGLPTLVLGTVWAWGLRLRPSNRPRAVTGWVASVPLAAVNAGISCALVLEPGGSTLGSVGAFFAGAIVGSIVWVPALLVTLLCFGLPLAWARRAAAQGLMGEERGEAVVGLATVVVSVLGACVWVDTPALSLSLLGLLAGGGVACLAAARHHRRSQFVDAAEAGKMAGFRVESRAGRRALVRVAAGREGYRAADVDIEVLLLEPAPSARRAARP